MFTKSIWIPITCANCGTSFEVKPSAAHRRVTCSRECSAALRSRRTKGIQLHDTHPGWNGGVAPSYYRRFLKGTCERCGSTRKLLIHHCDRNRNNNDLSNLETLCPFCHKREHALNRAATTYESRVHARFTEADVAAIRCRYAVGGITQQQIAAEYGVPQSAISRIVRGRTYGH